MSLPLKVKKDYYGGALLVIVGLLASYTASGYTLGTLSRMGPGFFPCALGVLMAVTGALIAATARSGAAKPAPAIAVPSAHGHGMPDLRGGLCIVAGIVAFIILGNYCGLVPATFAITFISAMGDRDNSVKQALVLSLATVAVAAVLFRWALNMQFPLFIWGA